MKHRVRYLVISLPTLAALALWLSHPLQKQYFPPRHATSSDDFVSLRDWTILYLRWYWMLPVAILAVLLFLRVRSAAAFFLACSVALPAIGWMVEYFALGSDGGPVALSTFAPWFFAPALALTGSLAYWFEQKKPNKAPEPTPTSVTPPADSS